MTQLELEMDVDQPVDKNGAHAIRDISLGRHVVSAWLILDLELAKVLVNVLYVLHNVVGLITISSVNIEDRDSRSDLATEQAFETANKRIALSRARAEC